LAWVAALLVPATGFIFHPKNAAPLSIYFVSCAIEQLPTLPAP
jgi:hypothetical protein